MAGEHRKHEIFRLNLNNEDERLIHEALQEQDNKSEFIKRAIMAAVVGVSLVFDEKNPRDAAIIEAAHRVSNHREWIKNLVYERLTGLDATTGNPISDNVRVIEKEIVVTQERVKVVEIEKPIYIQVAGTVAQDSETPAVTANRSVKDHDEHKGVDSVSW